MVYVVRSLAVAAALAAGTGSLAAQESPYAGYTGRPIKALADEQVAALLDGAGMGLALAAELNGFPGPKHVLELSDTLKIDDDQRAHLMRIFESMRGEAVLLGKRILALERELDSLFASGTIQRDRLGAVTGEIGRLQGTLRAVHLAAHLETTALLHVQQIRLYHEIRGYVVADHEHHRSHRQYE
jgi:hypothetical protein